MDARTHERWSLVLDHQQRLLAEARGERLLRERRASAPPRRFGRLLEYPPVRRWAAALHGPVPAPSRTLASYQGGACREGGINGTLRLIVLADGRRVLACRSAVETA